MTWVQSHMTQEISVPLDPPPVHSTLNLIGDAGTIMVYSPLGSILRVEMCFLYLLSPVKLSADGQYISMLTSTILTWSFSVTWKNLHIHEVTLQPRLKGYGAGRGVIWYYFHAAQSFCLSFIHQMCTLREVFSGCTSSQTLFLRRNSATDIWRTVRSWRFLCD